MSQKKFQRTQNQRDFLCGFVSCARWCRTEPKGQKEKPEDTLNTEYDVEAESEATTAEEEAPAQPKGSKEKPEDTLNTEDEAEAESEADASDEILVSLHKRVKCKKY